MYATVTSCCHFVLKLRASKPCPKASFATGCFNSVLFWLWVHIHPLHFCVKKQWSTRMTKKKCAKHAPDVSVIQIGLCLNS